jgi:hypothetical protein
MALTRMEAKQRPHKRFIGAVELGPAGGPYTGGAVTSGKTYRADYRGFPNFAGVNEWYAVTEAIEP